MAHLRPRFAEAHIRDAIAFSPLVGLIGMRQTGKTTLAERFAGDQYATLDDETSLLAATNSPQGFLAAFDGLAAIDECQLVPSLFPALKLAVQRSKRPGQFLLTGSVRFTSRKAIRESLTGRIYNIELLPLSVAELYSRDRLDFARWPTMPPVQIQRAIDRRLEFFSEAAMREYLEHGGLPGTCFLRKASHRAGKFRALIETILQRDVRLIVETSVEYPRLLTLLRHLAMTQGAPFVLKNACRVSGISEATVKKLLFAFESLFLVRRFTGLGDRTGDVFYLEDQGMASHLTTDFLSPPENRFAFSQLFAAAHYNHMNTMTLSHFETKGGALVPFVFQLKDKTIGFLFNNEETLTRSALKAAEALVHRFPEAHVFALSRSPSVVRATEFLTRIPLRGIV